MTVLETFVWNLRALCKKIFNFILCKIFLSARQKTVENNVFSKINLIPGLVAHWF